VFIKDLTMKNISHSNCGDCGDEADESLPKSGEQNDKELTDGDSTLPPNSPAKIRCIVKK